jgi:hypothetical protein
MRQQSRSTGPRKPDYGDECFLENAATDGCANSASSAGRSPGDRDGQRHRFLGALLQLVKKGAEITSR